MKIRIVPLRKEMLAQLAALEKQCFTDAWSEQAFLPELTNPLSLWLCAMDEETVAGYIGSQTVLGQSDMMNLAVAPDYRRMGLGTRLIQALIAELRQRFDTQCLTLEVRDSNAPAIALYEGLGFRQIGLRRNYYYHPREDARILRKELTDEHSGSGILVR